MTREAAMCLILGVAGVVGGVALYDHRVAVILAGVVLLVGAVAMLDDGTGGAK